MHLYPYQKKGVDFITARKVSLLADEMGLGKTVQAIAAINKLRALKALIICPAIAKINWRRELDTWLKNTDLSVHIIETRKEILPKADIYIVNYDLLIDVNIQAQLNNMRFAVGIVDEAHYLKNMKAKRTKAVLKKVKDPRKRGVIHNCVYKIFMTGTPILNRPIELFPLLFTCARDVIEPYSSYERYAFQWCGAYYSYGLNVRGASNLDDLKTRLSSSIMIRRRESEIENELPERRVKIMEIDPDPGVTIDTPENMESLGELATLRSQTALAKQKQILKYIEEKLDEKDKIVVFAYHRQVVEAIVEKFKDRGYSFARHVYGGMSKNRKQLAMDEFQSNPKCKLFVGQIQSVGVAISLTAANYALFAESSWVPGEINQCIKRLHRHGQANHCLFEFLVIRDSIEEQMLKSALRKAKIIKKAIG